MRSPRIAACLLGALGCAPAFVALARDDVASVRTDPAPEICFERDETAPAAPPPILRPCPRAPASVASAEDVAPATLDVDPDLTGPSDPVPDPEAPLDLERTRWLLRHGTEQERAEALERLARVDDATWTPLVDEALAGGLTAVRAAPLLARLAAWKDPARGGGSAKQAT